MKKATARKKNPRKAISRTVRISLKEAYQEVLEALGYSPEEVNKGDTVKDLSDVPEELEMNCGTLERIYGMEVKPGTRLIDVARHYRKEI